MTKKIDVHLHTDYQRVHHGDQTIPSVSDFIEDIFNNDNVEYGMILPAVLEDDLDKLESSYQAANDLAREIAEQNPGKFKWYCNIDPRMGDSTTETDLSEKYLNDYKLQGAVGVGELYAHMYLDDPYLQNLYKHCEQLGLPVLFHISPGKGQGYGIIEDEPGLHRLEKMLQKFPDLVFIGHSQCFWSEISSNVDEETRNGYPETPVESPGRVPYLLDNYPNLFADLSAGSGYNALIRTPEFGIEFLNKYQDKLMYGSDYLMPRDNVKTVELLDDLLDSNDLPQEAYDKICRRNAEMLFNL